MDKMSLLYVTKLIAKFDSNDFTQLFNLVDNISKWLSKSVNSIAGLEAFNHVQNELLKLAEYIITGKKLTKRSCYGLINALKSMQKEMLSKLKIVLFVTPKIKLKFNDNIKIIVIKNVEECIDTAYSMQEELKYLLHMNNEDINLELENAVDIVLTFEEILKEANICFPLDNFTYDRLYLTAKLNKIEKEKSKILFTGSSYTISGLLEDKIPCSSVNLGINNQDLYYSLLSVKEAIKRSDKLDTIVISFPYYFFFTNMNENPSDDMLFVLSKVNYPIYKKLKGYKGELLPVHKKEEDSPIYEAIIDMEFVLDIYHEAIVKELENMSYYNKINKRPPFGRLSYNFLERDDEENFMAGKLLANEHNSNFDLDMGLYNQKLLDNFLDDMEALNKKVILFLPPATKFYKSGILEDMVNSYNQLVMPLVNKHKICKFIDLYNLDKFSEEDFLDYDNLNVGGANKLSKIIASNIK